MSKSDVIELAGREAGADVLSELLLGEHAGRRTEDGKAGVVRNGYLPERELQTGLGAVTVRIPKVRARTSEAVSFHSALLNRHSLSIMPHRRRAGHRSRHAPDQAAAPARPRGARWPP